MRHFSLSYISLLTLCMVLAACGSDHYIKKGDTYLAIGEYYTAGSFYKTAYNKTQPKERQKRGTIALKTALCYDKINFNQKAVAAYRNAIRYGTATIDTHRSLAAVLMRTANYKEAAREYRLVLDSLPTDELALTGIEAAETATTEKKNGSTYTVKRMDVFNSRRADYSPMLTGDDSERLYFTSTRNETEGNELSGITGTKAGDIFVAQKDEHGKWLRPEQITTGLNTEEDEGACCITPDGGTMYLTQCISDASYPRPAQIAISQRADAAWGKATVLKITNDTLSNFAHPAVSPDGQWLYFTSDMPGGHGGYDLWRIRITTHGLGGVENLGPDINTAGDEMFPTFRPNGDLYFSSNGHGGFGGLDIFIAKVNEKTGLYELSHPGYPLNSQGDDFGMTFEGMHNRGFFSSNRGDAHGWDHIYSFEKPEIVQTVHGYVYERGGYELPAATVYIVGTDGTNQRLNVKSDGSFSFVLSPGEQYVLLGTCKGYLNHKEEITALPSPTASRDTTLQFALASIRVPVLIDNIFYDFDRATLRPESARSLDELVRLLNENPNVTIELAAHCDYKGTAEYNRRLSQQRAESVVRYLTEHGIDPRRLTPRGYGKDRPKAVTRRQAALNPWLKEGTVLTEEFIKELPEEHQAVCNQLNRRTEFSVLRTTFGMFDAEGKLKERATQKASPSTNNDKQQIIEIE